MTINKGFPISRPRIFERIQPNARMTGPLQNITINTTTVIDFDTTIYDTHSLADLTNNRFTINSSTEGYYYITANIEWELSQNGRRNFSLRLNGTTIIAQTTYEPEGGIQHSQNINMVYPLNNTDFVEAIVFHTDNAIGGIDILDSSDFSPTFSISKLSPL